MMYSQNPLRISIKNIAIIVAIIGIANTVTILLMDSLSIKGNLVFYVANVLSAGLVFPYVVLYKQRKEQFSMIRYGKFVALSLIAFGVVAYLFVVQF